MHKISLSLIVFTSTVFGAGCPETLNADAGMEADASFVSTDGGAGLISTDAGLISADAGSAASDAGFTALDGGTGLADGGQSSSSSCSSISAEIRARPVTTRVSPAANGQVNVDGVLKTLRQVVSDAQTGDVIVLADGLYVIPEADEGSYSGLYFTVDNVTLRSESGNRDAVVLDSNYANHGGQSAIITLDAAGVTLADFTVKRSIFHLVHIWADGDEAVLHNLVLEDGGQQFLKSSPSNDAVVEGVKVSCNSFQMTSAGRDNVWGYGAQDGGTRCYTGGIDTHGAQNWHIVDNVFTGIYCNSGGVQRPVHGKKAEVRNGETYRGGLSEYAIHMWDSAQGSAHLIERNQISNCARGIGLGMRNDVYGVIVRNNMIFSEHAASGEHDVGISVERGHDILILNNSVYFSSEQAYANAIEYRYEISSGLEIQNNVSNQRIFARNNAEADARNNRSDAEASWFRNAAAGDLHLSSCSIPALVGAGLPRADVFDDIDAEPRNGTNDVGADQCTN